MFAENKQSYGMELLVAGTKSTLDDHVARAQASHPLAFYEPLLLSALVVQQKHTLMLHGGHLLRSMAICLAEFTYTCGQ